MGVVLISGHGDSVHFQVFLWRSSEIALKKKKHGMMAFCAFRQSESVSWCSQPLEVNKRNSI